MYATRKLNMIFLIIPGAFEAIGVDMLRTDISYPSEETKKAIIGLSRDLRGLAFAFNTKAAFMMFFDWM